MQNEEDSFNNAQNGWERHERDPDAMIEDEDEERIMPEGDADSSVCYACTHPTTNFLNKNENFTRGESTAGMCICKKFK